MPGDGLVGPDRARRQLLRSSAHVLVLILRQHPDLPVLTWTVTPDFVRGHAEVCDLDPGRERRVFEVWADALVATEVGNPAPVLDEWGVTRLRANRRVNRVPVVLTAAVHPY